MPKFFVTRKIPHRVLEQYQNEVSMYKLDQEATKRMKNVAKEKLKLFGAISKV